MFLYWNESTYDCGLRNHLSGIDEIRRTEESRYDHRLHGVLLVAHGMTCPEVAAMKGHRECKLTLRSYEVESTPLPKVDSERIRDTRKRRHCSRAIFARKLRIIGRTLEKWEQGRGKQQLWFRWSASTLTHSSAWIGLPPRRKLSASSPVHCFTVRRVESSMAKGTSPRPR
jgi:DNA-binding transcriptional regulator YiaG